MTDDESSTESQDCRYDGLLRCNSADREESESVTLLSPAVRTAEQRDSSQMTSAGDALNPAFWMTDYKQPKRCRKGNCTFQAISKVSECRNLGILFFCTW